MYNIVQIFFCSLSNIFKIDIPRQIIVTGMADLGNFLLLEKRSLGKILRENREFGS